MNGSLHNFYNMEFFLKYQNILVKRINREIIGKGEEKINDKRVTSKKSFSRNPRLSIL